jgi:glutathione synthase
MRIALLMSFVESFGRVRETTSHLLYECSQKGHTVLFLKPHDLWPGCETSPCLWISP